MSRKKKHKSADGAQASTEDSTLETLSPGEHTESWQIEIDKPELAPAWQIETTSFGVEIDHPINF